MGRSLGVPTGHPEGSFVHNRSRVSIRQAGQTQVHAVEAGGATEQFPAAYYVGSGYAGHSYLVWVGDSLFQSPASFYSRSRQWRPSPGYESDGVLEFSRPVTSDCLFCHSGRALPIPGTRNRYQKPAFGEQAIGCDRCHGDTSRHLTTPSRDTIVNPARLPARERDSVCEQCHLSGEAVALEPGMHFEDFRPGMKLESVWSVFVREAGPEDRAARVTDHAEQLAQSRCSVASEGRLWCGSCHNPHERPADPSAYYRLKCLECHETARQTVRNHADPALDDCTRCHMPKGPVSDAPHTAFTNHRIAAAFSVAGGNSPPRVLRPWQPPEGSHARRNLGLAYISAGEKYASRELIQQGFAILADIQQSYLHDPEVLSALGLVLVRKRAAEPALRLLERAAQIRGMDDCRDWLNIGIAAHAARKRGRAVEALEKAIAIDPGLTEAYLLLAQIEKEAGDRGRARAALDRLLERMPGNRAALAARSGL